VEGDFPIACVAGELGLQETRRRSWGEHCPFASNVKLRRPESVLCVLEHNGRQTSGSKELQVCQY
jgi:hypothetical protein